MNTPSILKETRYDRLMIYYENLSKSPNEFTDTFYQGLLYKIPPVVQVDKNSYRKRFKVPIRMGHTKQYYVTLYNNYYKLYKKNSQLYFIECSSGLDRYTREQAFGTTMLYSYVAMMIYELIHWLTNNRNRYQIRVHDQVFDPLFSYQQWSIENPDVHLYISMFPDKSIKPTDDVISLSIFGDK